MKITRNKKTGAVTMVLKTTDEIETIWAAVDHSHIFDLDEHDKQAAIRRQVSEGFAAL